MANSGAKGKRVCFHGKANVCKASTHSAQTVGIKFVPCRTGMCSNVQAECYMRGLERWGGHTPFVSKNLTVSWGDGHVCCLIVRETNTPVETGYRAMWLVLEEWNGHVRCLDDERMSNLQYALIFFYVFNRFKRFHFSLRFIYRNQIWIVHVLKKED